MPGGLQIAGVCERDLDLLLVEELVATPEFRTWIADAAGLGALAAHVPPVVRRSVTHSSGESDVELYVQLLEGQSAAVLIENKVDAGLQFEQPERYTQRGVSYVAGGRCSVVRTLILAPQRYFGQKDHLKGFDAALTYEMIDQWYAGRPAMGDRAVYKRSLIAAAIEKATLGYQRVADGQMTEFWRTYHSWVEREAPELNMAEPVGRPAGSTFVFFRPDRLPKSVLLVHKFRHGHVDLEFTGWGDRLAELRERIQASLPPDCSLVRITKSAAVRRAVPQLDATSFASQEVAALVGIRAAQELLGWYRRHQSNLSSLGLPNG